MVKEGDRCKCKNAAGEWMDELVDVVEINGNIATIAGGSGEFRWLSNVDVSMLEPGEFRWTPTAEWIWNKGRASGESFYYCSRCAEGGSELGTDNFCSNCGAKMRKE